MRSPKINSIWPHRNHLKLTNSIYKEFGIVIECDSMITKISASKAFFIKIIICVCTQICMSTSAFLELYIAIIWQWLATGIFEMSILKIFAQYMI